MIEMMAPLYLFLFISVFMNLFLFTFSVMSLFS